MVHLHDVRDTDTHFIIDPVTRAIKNANSAKNTLMLGDHNSEIFTFQIPKEVEGHDMSLCNKVEVHYIDISADKANKSADVYKVKNMRVDDKQSDTLVFSWLISGNATKYAGTLNFRIRFACVDEDGIYTYKWHTDIFKGITISDGFDNTAAVVEEYSDILAAWERRIVALEEGGTGSAEDIKEAIESYLDENPIKGMTEEQEARLEENTNDIAGLKENKADKSDIPTVPTNISAFANDAKYVKENDLDNVIDDVLAQAKESGQFKGDAGYTPEIGTNGNWWINGVDTGKTALGTVISNTHINGEGHLIVTFTDGSELDVGVVKGDPYTLTDKDRTEIASEAAEMVKTPKKVSELDNDSGYITGIPDEYVTEDELPSVPTKVSELTNDKGYITDYTETDPTVPSWAKQPNKPTYTAAEVGARPADWMPTAENVGADPTGTAANKISEHNTKTDAHNDIRLLITELTNRLNTVADSDDIDLDQLSEIVAYIKANRTLIESITTNKINVADIIDNLTTNVSNKPLSAAQGVALKALIGAISVPTKLSDLAGDSSHRTVTDTEKSTWNAKSNFDGKYSSLEGKPTIPTVPTKLSAFTDDVGYLKDTELDSAINTALTQAKASGEFKGDPYTLTEADKNTIVSAVISALPVAEGVEY